MQKAAFTLAVILLTAISAFSQKYFTRDGKVVFNSNTVAEKIEGKHKSATCVLDTKTGKMEWKVLIKGFLFQKALMQEHFNENYLESSKYPDATFKGQLTNLSDINFTQDGKYNANAKGKLKIHGVERDVDIKGVIKVAGGVVTLQSNFVVACADYNIDIPSVVRESISKDIQVSVEAPLKPL